VSGGGAFTDQQVNGAKSRGASRGGGSATRSSSGRSEKENRGGGGAAGGGKVRRCRLTLSNPRWNRL